MGGKKPDKEMEEQVSQILKRVQPWMDNTAEKDFQLAQLNVRETLGVRGGISARTPPGTTAFAISQPPTKPQSKLPPLSKQSPR